MEIDMYRCLKSRLKPGKATNRYRSNGAACVGLKPVSVKRRRKKMRVKQGAVGHAAGYDDHSIISTIEHGKALPALDKAFRLAHALEASSIEELVTDTPTAESFLTPLSLVVMQWSVPYRVEVAAFLRLMADLVEMTPPPTS